MSSTNPKTRETGTRDYAPAPAPAPPSRALLPPACDTMPRDKRACSSPPTSWTVCTPFKQLGKAEWPGRHHFGGLLTAAPAAVTWRDHWRNTARTCDRGWEGINNTSGRETEAGGGANCVQSSKSRMGKRRSSATMFIRSTRVLLHAVQKSKIVLYPTTTHTQRTGWCRTWS